jgi:hypothetical protein
MRDDIIIENKDGYIHVRHYGRDSYDITLDMWQRIVAACEEYNCFNILGETYTKNRLSTMDNFGHVTIMKQAGVTLRHRIAWVAHGPEALADLKFVETVLLNRGLVLGKVFMSIEEAKRWLLDESKR